MNHFLSIIIGAKRGLEPRLDSPKLPVLYIYPYTTLPSYIVGIPLNKNN